MEKPKLNSGWINGGFFVLKNDIFDYIKDYQTTFERDPLAKLSKNKQLIAYLHNDYWQCMDNLKEKEYLDKLYKLKKTIWKINQF